MVHFTASEKITGDGDLQEINGGDLVKKLFYLLRF